MANVTVDMELNVRAFKNALKDATKQANAFSSNATKGFNTASGAFSSFIGNLAANAATAAFNGLKNLSIAVIDFGRNSIEAASKLEDLEVQFKTLTGSASQAKQIMSDLTSFAAKTPFQLEGLASTSAQLLSFGFNVDEIQGKLKSIGDVAAASGGSLSELGLIFGQVSAAGKLTGERLLQLQERGIPILEALARTMGVAESEVRNLVSNGSVSFEKFERAFISLSETGGFAFNGMVEKSKTLSGILSTLGDNWTLMSAKIGKSLLPLAKGLANFAIQTIQAFDINIIKNWITNGLLLAIEGLRNFAEAINPIVKGFQILLNAAQIAYRGIAVIVQAQLSVITGLWNQALNFILEGIALLPNNLVPESWIENLDYLKTKAEETTTFLVDNVSESSELIKEDFNQIGNAIDSNLLSEEQLAGFQERLDLAKNYIIENNSTIKSEQDKTDKDNAKRRKKELKNTKSFWQTHFGTVKEWKDATVQYEQLSEKQKQENLKSSLGVISTLTTSSNKELFFIGKAAAVSQATIDGVAAVQKALASAPPPFNFAIAAAVGVASAANVAKIASAKPPKYEQGGIVNGNNFSGDSLTARVNSGEMILNKQQQMNLFNQINSGGNASNTDSLLIELIDAVKQTRNTSVEIDGREIVNVVRSEISRGRTIA